MSLQEPRLSQPEFVPASFFPSVPPHDPQAAAARTILPRNPRIGGTAAPPREECGLCYSAFLLLRRSLRHCIYKLWLALLLLYGLALAPSIAFARHLGGGAKMAALRRSGWGPLHVTVQSPLQLKRLAFMHESPELHAPQSWHFDTGLTLANTWILNDGKLMVDEDVWTFNQTTEFTFNNWIALSARFSFQYLGGGFLDSPIENFHTAFGLGDQRRPQFSRDQVRMTAVQPNGAIRNMVDQGEGSLLTRAPVLSAKIRLNSPEAELPLTLKASLNFPALETSTNLVERGGNDWAVGLATAYRFSENLAGTASHAIVRSRRGTLLHEGDLKRRQVSTLLSLDYQFHDAAAIVGQLLRESPVAEGTDTGFDQPTTELALGLKWRISENTVWELAFVENVAVRDNSADFALHTAFSTTFN